MDKYINQVDCHKATVVFTYLSDIEHLYLRYKQGALDFEITYNLISRLFHYVKGLLFGLSVKHTNSIVVKNGARYEYISFYNGSSKSTKYTLCVNFDTENFALNYFKKERRKNER